MGQHDNIREIIEESTKDEKLIKKAEKKQSKEDMKEEQENKEKENKNEKEENEKDLIEGVLINFSHIMILDFQQHFFK